jgi:excinuclease ABC subunit C
MPGFDLPNLPHAPGVYLMRDQTGAIVYIGKALNLKKRVSTYFSPSGIEGRNRGPKIQTLVTDVRHVDYVPTASEREALLLEQRLIKRYLPTYNTMWKDGKTYPMVVLTMTEDFPRLRLTREKKKKGNLYFGPFPNVHSTRKLLRWIWRKKFFPLRPCDLDIVDKKPLPYEKVKSCLYLHTGECPAPCLGKISSARYKTIAKKAEWFFEGKKEKLVEQWKKEMAALSKATQYEQAGQVRDRILTIEHMNENVTFKEVNEQDLNIRVGQSRAIQELMKALHLPKPPQRIECFDISHIQGVEKVASMVSFLNGRPDKSQYRKFIIRTVDGIDDFKSMAEAVGRRYRRLKNEGRKMPDLVLIDGGKGQLSAALKALDEQELKKVPIAALAKEEEEIFVPGRKESIRLPLDSAALLLLRHVRDEAHRFAITFHRARRGKRTLEV